ncbi:hypothetical protein DO021_18895 [Desulfobacter hydrogenophilus]|uniref:Uncharacterized protein n=1 Tax=Desulfobacter hydrogenophilus TaxID=2291 RepID=A0A328FBG8_9BACT|nr:hypothetical protein [Desulfobacter hydrogenophilus]NDY73836.1 hypothetical protein [Desulfobacter hydrogenophilus]QBH13153.1 hypothetical protein EYB58_09620 [Desulfobacter hydrogenophilus]RAM00453.1 hypothetical protein DO021_18895 [Desulfobacter hydrogenophilus]
MQTLWMFIPEEAYILVIVGAGFALMLGLISGAKAWSIVVTVCLILVLAPFIGTIIEMLPFWAFLLLCVWMVITTCKILMGGRIFERVASKIIFELVVLPFRIVGRIFGFGRKR